MSETLVKVEMVEEVVPHPDADRLDVVTVGGYQVITQRGTFLAGEPAVYFPPDILIPNPLSERLGVQKYLKHATFPGDDGACQCRVGACRLRGIPSHGFLARVEDINQYGAYEFGHDLTNYLGCHKYVAPVRLGGGDAESEAVTFHRYTNIENIQRYGRLLEDGEEVVVTEKLHGSNCRMGLIEEGGQWKLAAGSHKHRRKSGQGLYWHFLSDNIEAMLCHLANNWPEGCEEGEYRCDKNAIVFGEIYGPGVQDMDYGEPDKCFRAFDISVNGIYLDYDEFVEHCEHFGVPMVPELYRGPYSSEKVEELTYGSTTFEGVKCKFKGREGAVVRPTKERHNHGRRVIFKSVSADYRDRRGAKDIGE